MNDSRPRAAATCVAVVLVVATLASGCPDDRPAAPEATPAASTPLLVTEGVVRTAELTPHPGGRTLPDRALLELAVRAADGPAHSHVRLSFFAITESGRAPRPTKVVSGEERLSLLPGTWDVLVDYRPAATASADGWIRGLDVAAGSATRLSVAVELRTGEIAVQLVNQGKPVETEARYAIFRTSASGEGSPDDKPVAEGRRAGRHTLPFGPYEVRADVSWNEAVTARLSRSGVVLDESHTTRELTLDFDRALGRIAPTATANGQRVDDDTEIVVEGTPASPPLRLTGWAGDTFVVPPGTYDVHATYRAGPLLVARRSQKGVTVSGDGEPVPAHFGLVVPSGTLRFRVLRDGVAIDGGVSARVFRAGADARALGEVALDEPLQLAPGRYDVEIRHDPRAAARPARTFRERGIVVEDGRETLREIRL